jgi:polyhydroxyalkanoate synthesis regulator protein
MRLIRRYANRKLYDTVDSQYVTLQHLAALIRQGEEIRVPTE